MTALTTKSYYYGLQLSFGPAEARLFVLNSYGRVASIKTDDEVAHTKNNMVIICSRSTYSVSL